MDTRARILEAATAVVAEVGVDGLAMRAVARRVGLTPMALYRHFEDKAALVETLVEELFGRLLLALQPASAEPTPRARFEAAVLCYVDFGLREPQAYASLFGRPLRAPDEAQRATREAATFRYLVDRIRELVDAGDLAIASRRSGSPDGPLESLAIDVWALMHGLLTLHRQRKFGFDDVALRAHVKGTLAQWFPPPSRGGRKS